MKKQTTTKIMAALLCTSLLATACGNDSSTSSTASSGTETSGESSTTTTTTSNVPAFEDIEFPDEMPTNPTLAEADYYDYDDMSQHYELELFTYNYGAAVPEDDPIAKYLEEKYNVDITLTTVPSNDIETALSTRFASNTEPDVIVGGTKDQIVTLSEQGLLVDAKKMYPYMPQTCKFATKTLIKYSTDANGNLAFATKYAVQDGDIWGYAVRQDWLDAFGMEPPTTKEELMAYADACVNQDPDGNGQADTYFMSGAGGGTSFGMLDGFRTMFGNTSAHVGDNGELIHPMFDDTTKNFLMFANELYSNGYLTPDWYTIDWEQNKSYTMNDRVGMVWYPASNLYQEYYEFTHSDDPEALNVWTFWAETPIENGKYGPSGNAGNPMAVSARKVGDDEGKLMRICHLLDAMCYGGEDYFSTVQGGGNEVHEGYDADVREYTEDNLSICYVDSTHPGYTKYGTNNLELAPWQNFGYTLKYQIAYQPDPDKQAYADKVNENAAIISSYERWPNDALLISIPAGTAPNLTEFQNAQEFKFVTGERSFDEWDQYVQEWLDQGGRDSINATAESLGCTVPDSMK